MDRNKKASNLGFLEKMNEIGYYRFTANWGWIIPQTLLHHRV